jgi:hypothetical protein
MKSVKKVLFLLFTIIFLSCSKNDDSNKNNNLKLILPKIILSERLINGVNEKVETTTKYDENKLIEVNSLNQRTIYTYTNEYITKIEIIKDKEKTTLTYIYENGKLNTENYEDLNDNGDGNISTTKNKTDYIYYGNIVTAVTTTLDNNTNQEKILYTTDFTIENGNIIKQILNFKDYSKNNIFEYDNKNNPLKNVKGLNLLMDPYRSSTNNIKKHSFFEKITSTDKIITPSNSTYNYEYNSDNYPIVIQYYYNEILVSKQTVSY